MHLDAVGCVRVKFWHLCQAFLTGGDLAIAIYRTYLLKFWHLCQAFLTGGDLAIAIYRTYMNLTRWFH